MNKKILLCLLLIICCITTGCSFHIHKYIEGKCDCGEFDQSWLAENYKLDEEKVLFNGSIDDDFTDDCILVSLKNSRTYPQLSLRHYGIESAQFIEHLFSEPKRWDFMTDEDWEKYLNNFHQIDIIHISPNGKENVIEIIKEIEKLPFVLAAEPNYLEHLD